eukprot:8221937-Prorocentrum_lima.AAC.1
MSGELILDSGATMCMGGIDLLTQIRELYSKHGNHLFPREATEHKTNRRVRWRCIIYLGGCFSTFAFSTLLDASVRARTSIKIWV